MAEPKATTSTAVTEAAALTTEADIAEVKKKLECENSMEPDTDLKYDGDVDDNPMGRSMPDLSYRRSKTRRSDFSSHSQLSEEMEIDMDLYLPPGRINATSGPLYLSGQISSQSSLSNFQIPSAPQIAPPSPRSRSRSRSSEKATATTHDGNSSISSLEEMVDSDILYDSAGRSDLDVPTVISARQKLHNSSGCALASVNERLSEDTLEDVHAFSDAAPVRSSNASRVSVTEKDQELALERLDELDEESVDEEEDINPKSLTLPTVILTNMENLKIQQGGDDEGSLRPRAGMSHVCESISEAISEAPSSTA